AYRSPALLSRQRAVRGLRSHRSRLRLRRPALARRGVRGRRRRLLDAARIPRASPRAAWDLPRRPRPAEARAARRFRCDAWRPPPAPLGRHARQRALERRPSRGAAGAGQPGGAAAHGAGLRGGVAAELRGRRMGPLQRPLLPLPLPLLLVYTPPP